MVSRRRFLSMGLWGGGIALSWSLVGCSSGSYPAVEGTLRVLSPKQFWVLEAACEAILPDRPGMARASDLPRRIDAVFASASPNLQGEFKQLLDLIEDMPWLNFSFTPFTRQSLSDRQATLGGWEHSRLAIKRLGFQGLKKVISGVFYMQPESWPEIGYPGPWIGRIDVGTGLDNRGNQPCLNPNALRTFEA